MLMSEQLDKAVNQNMDASYQLEDKFMVQYFQYLKQNVAVISRYRRLCRTLLRDPRIILKAELLPTLSYKDQMKYYEMKDQYQMRMKDDVLDCVSEISTSNNPFKEANKWNKLPWFSIHVEDNGICKVIYEDDSFCFLPMGLVYHFILSSAK